MFASKLAELFFLRAKVGTLVSRGEPAVGHGFFDDHF